MPKPRAPGGETASAPAAPGLLHPSVIEHLPLTPAADTAHDGEADVLVIGGGPSGSVAARLLASWGHRVCLVARPVDPSRALANSLPPSTRSLLRQTGTLDIVERIGMPTHGNTVWWGAREGDVQPFASGDQAHGFQIDRARLDPALLDAAGQAGVCVTAGRVGRVDRDGPAALVRYDRNGEPRACRAQIVVDASGRAGVLAQPLGLRRHIRGGQMQALVGVWHRSGAWPIAHPTHTLIETCDEGWAWSIGTSMDERHVGIMVDGATSRLTRRGTLAETYLAQLTLTGHLAAHAVGATLIRVFACDASVYTARSHADGHVLLVGDSGSTLNPLSSFGIKKALASAWLGAVTAHTMLVAPSRADVARTFFSDWSARAWQANLARSREFAIEAARTHDSVFWRAQAGVPVDAAMLPLDERALLDGPDVHAALMSLRTHDRIVLTPGPALTRTSAPLVRGREVVVEDALVLGSTSRDVARYLCGIDLVAVSTMAPTCVSVPSLFEEYVRRHGPVPLPEFLRVLSCLLARRMLVATPLAAAGR
ncbi:MAG: FAD-dependent monooxygenase [Acidobacteria bacterium]|nr:FAD-dependent monooxygenase [Acidobacteriota bacterium]